MNCTAESINAKQYLLKWLDDKKCFADIESCGEEISPPLLHFNIMSDCVNFVHKQGLMERQMQLFINFFNRMFTDTICSELLIHDAVLLIKKRLTTFFESENFSSLFVISAIDYITTTILQHYHLMMFVMKNEREEELHMLTEGIEVPPQPEMLKTATAFSIWELESKIKEKETKYELQKKELDDKFLLIKSKLAEEIDSYMMLNEDTQLNSASILNIISVILCKHTELTSTELQSVMEASKQMISLNIEKTKLISADKKR